MPDSEIPYNCRKQQSLPYLPAFAVVDFPNNNFVLYLLPFLPGSNSSKFYINDQLLCKSSLSLVRVCTPICPLLSLNNSPSEHLFHCIWVISVQVLASARLWPPEGLGSTSFLTCRALYNVWPMFVDQYMFVLDYFTADTITWLN